MALEKAYIQALDERGRDKGERIAVMFNPESYSIDKSVNYQRTNLPGLQTPITQFVYGNARTLKLDLMFDSYDKREDVRDQTSKISGLLNIDSELHAPPVVRFIWGKLDFKAVIDSVNQNFTMFLDSGIPVRAKLTVSFTEFRTLSEQLEGTPLFSSDQTKTCVVTQADSLWQLANKYYNDPGQWRNIAQANNIENPRVLDAGSTLTIPPL